MCLETDADGNAVFRDLEGVELYRGKADGQGRGLYYDRLSAVSYSVAESIRRARTLRGQTPRGLLFVAL